MNRVFYSVVLSVVLGISGSLTAAEYGSADYTGSAAEPVQTVSTEQAVSTDQAVSTTSPETIQDDSSSDVKCFWGYRWYYQYNYYYTPTVYYYRPVTYYYNWYYNYSYCYQYQYVSFYKSMDTKSATNEEGILIRETPASGTPLAALGIVKGDVITGIDGKAITHPSQLDAITAQSKLQVIRAGRTNKRPSAAADTVPATTGEYGAFEY